MIQVAFYDTAEDSVFDFAVIKMCIRDRNGRG